MLTVASIEGYASGRQHPALRGMFVNLPVCRHEDRSTWRVRLADGVLRGRAPRNPWYRCAHGVVGYSWRDD